MFGGSNSYESLTYHWDMLPVDSTGVPLSAIIADVYIMYLMLHLFEHKTGTLSTCAGLHLRRRLLFVPVLANPKEIIVTPRVISNVPRYYCVQNDGRSMHSRLHQPPVI